MKIARPCPVCGEIVLSNRCKGCGHELLPETQKPKVAEEKATKGKPKRPGWDKVLKF